MKNRFLRAALAALVLATSAIAQVAAGSVDAAALNRQSIERLAQKNAKDSVALAEQAIQADPTTAAYFSQLGIALGARMNEVNFMQMGALSSKLKKAFEQSIALDPHHLPGLIGLARFYANAPEIAGGSLAKAAEFAARVEKLDPFLGALEFGRIQERDEQFPEALARFETAARLKPDSAGAHHACGRVLAKLGRKEEARAHFETALKLNPGFAAARQALAELDAPAT